MPINSRQKGARAERQFRDLLRAEGYLNARRGQQFSGGPASPDVVCPELEFVHWEIKSVERLNIEDAMDQARRECGRKVPVVAHKRSFRPWLITMRAEFFFRLLRGDIPNFDSVAPVPSALTGLSPKANSLDRFPSDPNLRGVLPPEDKPNQQQNERTENI